MRTCRKCGNDGFALLEVKDGKCPACRQQERDAKASKTDAQREEEKAAKKAAILAASAVMVTTETSIDQKVERLGIVAGEAVLGMNVFKDIAANFRDIFGGRSAVVQNTLKQAREIAIEDLKIAAAALHADAVIAVHIDYHSISTAPAVNMMMVTASGTAVKFE